jgi:hypothetical protein
MKRLMALALLGALSADVAGAKPACDELAGSVIFYDTLYGMGTGLILSGLVLAAADDSEDAGQKLAGGTLIGATIGAAAGALELGMRDCPDDSKTGAQPGLTTGLALLDRGPAASLTWRW